MNQIEIFMLEDNPRDAEMEMRELRREGIQFNVKRVWTEEDFVVGLRNPGIDLILADYRLPVYDGLSALKLAHRERPEVPFIFVSGTLGEETAVDALHHGATDYVLKQRLGRLGPSVRRVLQQAQEHKQVVQMAQQLAEGEKRYRELFGQIKSGVAVFEVRANGEDFVFKDFNPAAEQIDNMKKESLIGKSVAEVFPHVRQLGLLDIFRRVWKTGMPEHLSAPVHQDERGISWRENHVYKLPSGELVTVYDDVTERKQSDERVKISEGRLRQALEAGQMGAWELDLVSDASWRTPRHDQIFGYDSPPAAWNYEIFLKHVVPEDLEMVKQCFAQALSTDRLSLECRIIRAGQSPRWTAIQGHVHRNEKGERVRLMGTVSDISERKLMEKALRESEERTRAIADSAQDAILMMDTGGLVSYWNPAAERIFGYTSAEAIGQKLHEFIVPGRHLRAHHAAFPAFLQTGQGAAVGKTLDMEAIRKDGKELSVQISLSAIRMNDGWHAVGILRDISERKRVEESHARLATAVEQVAEAIMITDAKGTILYTNPAFERVTGYSCKEAVEQNPRILKSGKHDAAFYRQMWEVLSHGELWSGHIINKRKDGALYEEETSISPVRNAAGKIVNYVAVKRDVTREVAQEAQLRESQRLESIGTLAGGVAHEINNPINGIMNYAQLMATRLAADSPLVEYATEIIKETDRIAFIVRNLLAFARQEKRQHELTSVSDIVTTSLSLIQTVMRHDQVTLTVDIPKDLPKVKCHSRQIQQVLMNLLTNARDALNEKYLGFNEEKVIRISARRIEKDGKSWIRMTVEDHGPGIPQEVGDRIFDPFFTTKLGKGGTGLGLSISHGIVKEHNGELHFETETGRYTRFHLDLPITKEEQS